MKTEKIEKYPDPNSAQAIETQHLDQPGKENVYEEGAEALDKALQIISAGLGSIDIGLDAKDTEYFRLKYKDFEFYTIYKGQITLLKAALANRG